MNIIHTKVTLAKQAQEQGGRLEGSPPYHPKMMLTEGNPLGKSAII